jgi:integrative and conjugative element protein (TIGR02256 family)
MFSKEIRIGGDTLGQCRAELSNFYPLESGGIFFGSVSEHGNRIIEGIIGPGPGATRTRYALEVDHEWQNERLASIFRSSNGQLSYLGDWHSHPQASIGDLSRTDMRVLKKLAACETLTPEPVMAIFFGGPEEWEVAFWAGRLKQRLFSPFKKLVYQRLSVVLS